MRKWAQNLFIAAFAWIAAGAQVDAQPQPSPVSQVRLSCTGTDFLSATRIAGVYPIVVRFLGNRGQPVGDEVFTISGQDGRNPMTIACDTPQIYMQLPTGRYMASADMAEGPTKIVTFRVVKSRATRTLTIRFPTITASVPKSP